MPSRCLYPEGGKFPAETTEDCFDKLTMIAQQLEDLATSNDMLPPTSTETGSDLAVWINEQVQAAGASASAAATSEANAAASAADAATSEANAMDAANRAAMSEEDVLAAAGRAEASAEAAAGSEEAAAMWASDASDFADSAALSAAAAMGAAGLPDVTTAEPGDVMSAIWNDDLGQLMPEWKAGGGVPTASPTQDGTVVRGGKAGQVYKTNAAGTAYGWEDMPIPPATPLATPTQQGSAPAGGTAGQVYKVNAAGDAYGWEDFNGGSLALPDGTPGIVGVDNVTTKVDAQGIISTFVTPTQMAGKLDTDIYVANNRFLADEVDTGRTWIDGKRIYRKVVNCGAGPNNANKNVPHNILNISRVVSLQAISWQTGSLQWRPMPWSPPTAAVSATQIIIGGNADYTNWSEIYVILEYTCTDR